jgi:HemY protein
MINLLLLLLLLTCLGITAAWIAENPGHVTIFWFDYRIDTSFAVLLLLLLVSILVAAYAYILLRRIIFLPEILTRRRNLKLYEKGLAQLTRSIAALAAADAKAADMHTRKAEKLLGRTPLTLLLSAQIARTQGDDARTHALLNKMLEHKETEYIAARYLSEFESKQQHFPRALQMAQRAHAINPHEIGQVLSLHIRLGEWQQAITAIDKAMRRGKISRQEVLHYKGLVYLQQAMQLHETGQDESALTTARYALKYAPNFVPAIVLASKLLVANDHRAHAIRMIQKAWKKTPHLLLGNAYRSAISSEPKEKQIKLARKLAAGNPDTYESHIVIAQTAISLGAWATAREALKAALAKSETVLACKLMATVEQGEFSDYDISGKWLGKSATALSDPAWVCTSCGHAPEEWDTHCPSCHSFDSLEWKRRDYRFQASQSA